MATDRENAEQHMLANKHSKQAWKDLNDAGVWDRMHAEDRETAAGVEKWYAGTKHLYEPEHQKEIEKIIAYGKRGIMTGPELHQRMSDITSMYMPNDEPQNTIPDHLSDQFISDVNSRFGVGGADTSRKKKKKLD